MLLTMALASLILGALVLSTIAWSAFQYLTRKERLPDVEFIRLSDKPGKAGDADDVQAFLNDSLGAIMKGYNEVRPASHNPSFVTLRHVYAVLEKGQAFLVKNTPTSILHRGLNSSGRNSSNARQSTQPTGSREHHLPSQAQFPP